MLLAEIERGSCVVCMSLLLRGWKEFNFSPKWQRDRVGSFCQTICVSVGPKAKKQSKGIQHPLAFCFYLFEIFFAYVSYACEIVLAYLSGLGLVSSLFRFVADSFHDPDSVSQKTHP